MPIYKVATVVDGEQGAVEKVRLIRAGNKLQAKAHAADAHITVALASEDDLIELTKANVEVEKVVE